MKAYKLLTDPNQYKLDGDQQTTVLIMALIQDVEVLRQQVQLLKAEVKCK